MLQGGNLVAHGVTRLQAQGRNLAANDLLVNGLIDTQHRSAYLPAFFSKLALSVAGGHMVLVDYKGRLVAGNLGPETKFSPSNTVVREVATGNEVLRLSAMGLDLAFPVIYGGHTEGSLIIHVPPTALEDVFALDRVAEPLAVVDAEGRTLISTRDLNWNDGDDRDAASPASIRARGELPSIDGVHIVAALPAEMAFAPLSKIFRALIVGLIISVATLVGAILATVLIANREVRRLIATVAGVGDSTDLEQRIELSGPAELAELGESFNAMLGRLRQTTLSRDHVDRIFNSVGEIIIVGEARGLVRSLNPAARIFAAHRGFDNPESLNIIASGVPRIDAEIDGFLNLTDESGRTIEVDYAEADGSSCTIRWSKALTWDRRGIQRHHPGGRRYHRHQSGERARGNRQPRQIPFPGHHEPRNSHALEWRSRVPRLNARNDTQCRTAPVRQRQPKLRRKPARYHQRHSRFFENGSRSTAVRERRVQSDDAGVRYYPLFPG